MERIVIGSDHAGFSLKEEVKEFLLERGHEVMDKGTYSDDSVDYPDFAHPTAEEVEQSADTKGILICGSANGVAIAANKHQGIRAGIAWEPELARLTRQHNNANIICLPARFIDREQAIDCVEAFLTTEFEGGRHERRVGKIACS